MSETLRLLQVEDSPGDAALIVRSLEKSGYDVRAERVEDASAMRAALTSRTWDVIIADYHLPQFDAPSALAVLHAIGLDIPFIVVSGAMGEDLAVAMMKAGAHDYLMKDKLARLPPAVEREISDAYSRRERRRAEVALRVALIAAEERQNLLDTVFKARSDGVFVWDNNGFVIRTNPAAVSFCGFDPTGMSFDDIIARLHLATNSRSCTAGRALRGESAGGADYHVGDRILETFSAPMRDATGAISGAVTIARDITERRKAEERLRQAQKLESIGMLAGGIAHDFNNILTTVIGNISLAIEDPSLDEGIRSFLGDALESSMRAAGLTRQLLAYSGKGAFVRERVSVSSVAEKTVSSLGPSLPDRIDIKTDFGNELPPALMDRNQMEQVLMSLILNGVEAIPDDKRGTVTVRTGRLGDSLNIEVSDTGCGMDQETQSRMFEPFFTTKFTGRGLSLAAVDGIVRSLDGRISVESNPGSGTRVRVLLPASNVSEVISITTAPSYDGRVKGAVLLVDDEADIRKMAATLLKRRGIAVFEAATGREAINIVATSGPELRAVLLDMALPEMTGEEVLPIITKLRPDIQVVVSSGFSEPEVEEHFHAMNVRSFLPKPYTGDQLLAHLLPVVKCQ